jgi:hypothetical protein
LNCRWQWNTLDLITFNGDSIHVVNGRVVMRLHNAQRLEDDAPEPITSGKICLQTKAANVPSAMLKSSLSPKFRLNLRNTEAAI